MNLNENQHSDDISELDELLKVLTTDQIRYVIARQETSTDKEAARKIGVSNSTVSVWGEPVKRAVQLMAIDGVHVAREILRRNLPKAMAVKAAGLESDNEKVRQDAATEIIDREMGKPLQKSKNETEISGVITVDFEEKLKKVYGD